MKNTRFDYTAVNLSAQRIWLRVLLIAVLIIQINSSTTPNTSEAPASGPAIFLNSTITATAVTLNWNAPQANEGISKYRLILTGPGHERGAIKYKKATEARTEPFRKLHPCGEYIVVLTPLNDEENAIGENSTLQFNTTFGAPPVVRELSTPSTTAQSIGVSWQRPDTGCNITKYDITATEITNDGAESKQSVHKVTNFTGSAEVESLQPYTKYRVTVTASNEAGGGESTFITATTQQAAPSPPTKLEVTNKSPTALTVSWKQPEKINGVLGQYTVSWNRNSTRVPYTFHTITDLSPCVEYTVRVAANTGAGEGEYAEVKTTTSAEDPSQPCCFPNSTTETIVVTWTEPSTSWPITSYEVSWAGHTAVVNSSALQHTLRNTSTQSLSSVCVVALGDTERGGKACCSRATPDAEQSKEKKNIGIIVVAVASVVVVAVLLLAFVKRGAIQNHLCSHKNERESSLSLTESSRSLDHLTGPNAVSPLVARSDRPTRAPSDVPMPELTSEEIGLTEDTSDMIRADNLIYSVYSVVEEYYSDLESRVKHQLEILRNPERVATEFDQLNKESFVGETSAGQLPVNMRKNRYSNIIPFDSNRVRLRNAPDSTTDYINASFVQSSVAEDVGFIACQSPKANTVSDFWWMVWEQNIRIIVMLVRSDEGEKTKCTQYWPVLCEQSFSTLVLKTVNKEVTGGLVIRNMLLKNDNESRAVRHFQFTSWPDFGVPDSDSDLLMLVKEVREHIQPGMRNIIVHCSAGVGRTGTFIALWQLQVQAERRMPGVDVRETVLELRRHREMLVQKPEQYYFLHKCFLKYIQEINIWKPTIGAAHFSEASGLTMDTPV